MLLINNHRFAISNPTDSPSRIIGGYSNSSTTQITTTWTITSYSLRSNLKLNLP